MMTESRPSLDHDVNAIKQLGQEFFQAASAAETNRCIATMADDVVVMPPDQPSIIGIEQLRRLSSDYHSTYEVKYSLVFDEVTVAGDIAIA